MSVTVSPPPTSDGEPIAVVPETAEASVPDEGWVVAPPPDRWNAPAEVAPPRWADVRNAATNMSRFLGMRLAGWVLLGTGVALLIAGWLLSWLELRVAGVSAIALALVAMLFTLGRPSLVVTMKVPDRHVQVGQRATGELVVRNAGRSLSDLDVALGHLHRHGQRRPAEREEHGHQGKRDRGHPGD